jgi:hypothetical protein
MSSSAARTAAMPGGHEPWSALLAGDAWSPRTVRWRRQGETVEILDPLDADAGYEPAHPIWAEMVWPNEAAVDLCVPPAHGHRGGDEGGGRIGAHDGKARPGRE